VNKLQIAILIADDDWKGLEAQVLKRQRVTAADNVTYEYARHHIIGVEKPVALS